MIYVEMQGRCGNQLFRYAFARCLQEKKSDNLVISFNEIEQHNGEKGWINELENFNVVPYILYEKKGRILFNETNLIQKVLCFMYRLIIKFTMGYTRTQKVIIRRKFQGILSRFGIYWLREGYYPYKFWNSKKRFVSGSFEALQFFDSVEGLREKLLKELTPKKEVMECNLDLLQKIENSNSVCVNVRRGDFLANEFRDSIQVCNLAYFEEAYEIMEKTLTEKNYFVFSDDIEWCKEKMSFIKNAYYVSDKMPPYETLRLMYSCKHFIISNSTFSWWGQYLSRNDKKIVISPSRWNNDGYDSPLIDKDNWILIDCEEC